MKFERKFALTILLEDEFEARVLVSILILSLQVYSDKGLPYEEVAIVKRVIEGLQNLGVKES